MKNPGKVKNSDHKEKLHLQKTAPDSAVRPNLMETKQIMEKRK